MSQSSSNNPPPASSSSQDAAQDWRASVAQATRSAEVRVVADILAKMEHGATPSSKLMLAMRFEEDIFQKATSLADYQKHIQKRLKKFTKNYKASTVPSPIPSNSNTEERLVQLKLKYGEKLKFICDHADAAIAAVLVKTKNEDPTKAKTNVEKARSLKQHTENAKVWATNLGILEGTSPNTGMDSKAIDDLQTLLEHRLDNIKSHVMRLANLDLLIQETLEKLEQDMTDSTSQLLAAATSRRVARLGWNDFNDPIQALSENLKKAQAIIPPPSKSKESQREAALKYLEKMRAASQAVLAFLDIPNKGEIADMDVLLKCHTAAMQTLDFIAQVMPDLVDLKKEKSAQVKLQDAWLKVMEFPTTVELSSASSLEQRSAKRCKTSPAVMIRSRVLLTPGRKTPSNLLPELKRKGARLVRPPPNGEGTFLLVEFGNAFCMTIYLVPLLVTIRASTKTTDKATIVTEDEECASWTPVQAGLEERPELQIWGVSGTADTVGSVIQGQLEYASAHATAVLRKFFSDTTDGAMNDFEVEISEGTALLQFLQLARTTYTPNFKELD